MTDTPPKIIHCDVHGWQPWHIICECLIHDPSLPWCEIEVDDGREVEADYLCSDCLQQHLAGNDPIDKLTICCAMHLRELRQCSSSSD